MQKTKIVRKELPARGTREAAVSSDALVQIRPLREGEPLPLLITPTVAGVSLVEWAASHRDLIQSHLHTHGGILFRGFAVDLLQEFETFIAAVSNGALTYEERSSPRSQVRGNIYTSTDHPASQSIFLHNEQSYNLSFPLRILFACVTAAQSGGATPIADVRAIYQRLDPAIRQKFIEKQYMYVRNFGDGFGLSWQEAFQTDDKARLEEYCRTNGIDVEWKGENRLRTRQIRPAVARHPVTGELAWFNHATFFHISTLDAATQTALRAAFDDEDLPNNTFYGDGTPIEPEVMETLRSLYEEATVRFTWQVGDVLMLDNMLTAHARDPFVGPRKILTGMADPCSWEDVRSV
ncbi:MAG TPA: TauD/TfdA family dioxygenase [Herpetosiphonaceae bacterium]